MTQQAVAGITAAGARGAMDLVLSLFPGLGLLDRAFEEEGFTVVRGPDVLWGGDIRRFHPPAGRFDGVIGGPPCQEFSSLVHLVRANGHEPRFGNLIPEFERCVREAQPEWFLMENVPKAPDPAIDGYGVHTFMLDNSALDAGDGFGQEQRRLRKFDFGLRGRAPVSLLRWIDLATFTLPDAEATQSGSGGVNWTATDKEIGRVRQPAATSNSGERPSEKKRRGHGTATHDDLAKVTEWSKRQRHKALTGSKGGTGKDRVCAGRPDNGRGRYKLADACRLQGLPEDFLADAPFTADGKLKAVANGVPLFMGRAIASAVKDATTAKQ